jgi:hypothetical protein
MAWVTPWLFILPQVYLLFLSLAESREYVSFSPSIYVALVKKYNRPVDKVSSDVFPGILSRMMNG